MFQLLGEKDNAEFFTRLRVATEKNYSDGRKGCLLELFSEEDVEHLIANGRGWDNKD